MPPWFKRVHRDEFITGERLQALAAGSFITADVQRFHRSLGSVSTRLIHFAGPAQPELRWEDIPHEAQEAASFFVYTHLLDDFFRAIFPALRRPFVLVTHNSDHAVDERYRTQMDDGRILAWYAQNVAVRHPKLHSIPIGIANAQWPHGALEAVEQAIAAKPEPFKNVYMGFDASTNVDARAAAQAHLVNKPFVSPCARKPFGEYLVELSEHRFCIAPQGNGLDSHRVWECLYLGVVPIVLRKSIYADFPELPMVMVDDWRDLEASFLDAEYARICGQSWNLEALTLSHWRARMEADRMQTWPMMAGNA